MRRFVHLVVGLFLVLASSVSAQEGVMQAQEGRVNPVVPPKMEWKATLPAFSESERQRMEQILQGVNISVPIPDGPSPGPAPAVPLEFPPSLSTSGPAPQAPGDLVVARLTSLGGAAGGLKSTVGEPTVSGYGNILLQSGNWYLAVSFDAGASWGFVDPFALLAGVDGGFCCDQVVRYEPSRDLLLYLTMSVPSGATGRDTLRLFAIHGLRSGCCAIVAYDFTPQGIGLPAGQWHDYPKMTVGKNNVYITTNRFAPAPGGSFQGSTLYRLPLDPLKAGAGFGFNFFNMSEPSPLVAEGIGDSDTAYWGSNINTSTLRIFRWAESSTTIFSTDVAVATWSDAARVCVGPDGRDFGGRVDGRLQFAVFSNRTDGVDGKQLLFMQSSAAQPSSGRAFAYMRGTRVAVGTWAPLDTRDFAFGDVCAIYAAGSVNSQGGIGLSSFVGGGALTPSHLVALWDEFGGTGTFPFQFAVIRGSTQGPNSNAWGDYLSVDPLSPITCAFQTAGYVLIGGGAGTNVDPHYASFGREKCFP